MTIATVAEMIREAEKYADDHSADRIRATEYYLGDMKDLPSDEGRSSVVSRDLRAHLHKVLPSIMRTIFGSERVVEYQPAGENDEAGAEQATDYVNFVVMPETDARKAIYDAIFDALLLRNGILKWWWDERKCVKFSHHTGLTEMELAQLLSDGGEVVEQDTRQEAIETPEGMMPVEVFDVKIRREYTDRKICVSAVPRERFLIHPDATSLDDSILTGERMELRRSDLVAMGYDKEMVMGLALAGEDDTESDIRRDTVTDTDEADKANDAIDYYEVYVRTDLDGDGIAELRRMCFAGALHERNLLVDEEVDEIQMCDLTAFPQPHQWEGASLADDLIEVQRIKTALMRQTLDNIYWQNNPQPMVQLSAVMNPDAVMEPKFGQPIMLKDGRSAAEVIQYTQVPFMAAQSFGMMEYMDGEAADRTGINDASAGLAPDALQNMTAKGAALMEQGGIARTEMMVRNIAEGLRVFFRGLLRLVIRHSDKPRTVRLRDEWVEVDPRHWNAAMDAVVNVGLGAGTRERDMIALQFVMGLQEKLLAAFGADNPFVKPEHVYNALAKTVEAAGLKTPSMYFAEPDPQEIAAKMQAAQNQPNPEVEKIQAEMQLKQADMQMKMQLEQAKIQTQRDKENAQMQADLQVKRAEIEAESIRQQEEFAYKSAEQERQLAWEREKFAAEMAMRQQEAETRRRDEFAKINAAAARQAQQGVSQ